jgi:predicted Mrr-cat superfamily restriction endonuclease
MKFWLLKAAGTLEDEEIILENSVITIGGAEFPDLSCIKNEEQVKKFILDKYPGMRGELFETWTGEICSFIVKLKKGDLVAVPLKRRNEVLIGKVTGDYECRQLSDFISHIRKVRWFKTISKSDFEEEYDVDFNSPQTLFSIKADLQNLSALVGTKSLESLIEELNFALEDLNFMKERLLEFAYRLAETDEISEVRKIAAEMEQVLKEK